MGFINKNNFGIKFIIICLLIGGSACSKETEKVADADVDSDQIKSLQERIEETHKKYLEIDAQQKKQKEDVTTQLNSISCSLIRLTKIKFNRPPADNIDIKSRLAMIDFLEITDEKKTDFFKVKIARKYNYRNDYEYVMSGIEKHTNCLEYYERIIPKSQDAKNLEAKVFDNEIERATKRLKSFPKRFEILERLASEATTCQSFLQKSLDEYLVDKAPAIAKDGLDKAKDCLAEIDKGIKQPNEIAEMAEAPPKQAETSFWDNLFE